MTTTFDPSNLSALPGRQALRKDDEAQARQRVARQSLSLGSFFKPFVAFGGGFLSKLWAAMVALVRRAASVFKVDVNMPGHTNAAAAAAGDVPIAEFTSRDPVDGAENVQAAAKEAAKDLSEMVARLTSQRVDKDRIRAPGGAVYVALNLQSLGAALAQTRAELHASDRGLVAAAQDASVKSGVPAADLKTFLLECNFTDPASPDYFSADIQAQAQKHARLKSMLCELQLRFCDMAITSFRVARGDEGVGLEQMTRSKVFQFADQEMAELIFDKSATSFETAEADLVVDSSLPNIESKKTVLSDSRPASGRSRWAGVSAGEVDGDADDAEKGQAPRQRES